LDELDKNQTIAVLCRSGGRSANATVLLNNAGFKSVYNITGGIIAWAQEIDPNVPIY